MRSTQNYFGVMDEDHIHWMSVAAEMDVVHTNYLRIHCDAVSLTDGINIITKEVVMLWHHFRSALPVFSFPLILPATLKHSVPWSTGRVRANAECGIALEFQSTEF